MHGTQNLKQVRIIDDSPLFDDSSEIYDIEDLSETKKTQIRNYNGISNDNNNNFRFKEMGRDSDLDNIDNANNYSLINNLDQYIKDNKLRLFQRTKHNLESLTNNTPQANLHQSYCMKLVKPNELINDSDSNKLINITNNSNSYYANDEFGNILEVSFCENLVDKSCSVKIQFISKMYIVIINKIVIIQYSNL